VPAWGNAPVIPAAKPQGAIPTLKMPSAKGWTDGQKPVAAPGLKVNAFASGLRHPRWIYVLPNGDVLVAEAKTVPGPVRNVLDGLHALRQGPQATAALQQDRRRPPRGGLLDTFRMAGQAALPFGATRACAGHS
jgi:glucose/arabinose dehydrogenase